MAGDVPGAREILERAFIANPESEQIWLAAVKLEAENGEHVVARELLARARKVADTERVRILVHLVYSHDSPGCSLFQIWMKSAVFERQRGQLAQSLETINAGLAKYPSFAKLHMLKGQVLTDGKDIPNARAAYAVGVKACPKSVPLWILASRLEELDNRTIKARALLEKARLVNVKDESLWAESVGVEERAGSIPQAKAVLARGKLIFINNVRATHMSIIRSSGLSNLRSFILHLHLV